jgi:hypothetical protein
VSQATLTIVTEVAPDDPKVVQDLSATLESLGGVRGQSLLPFARAEGLHFARFAIVKDPAVTKTPRPDVLLPTLLVLSLVFDEPEGGRAEVVDRLVAVARPNLDAIYAACAGYPGQAAPASEVRAYLLGKNVEPALFYQGVEATVGAVRETGEFRRRLETELDRLMCRGGSNETPTAVARALRAAVPGVDPRVVPASVERLSGAALAFRTILWALVVFGAPALLLAGVPVALAVTFEASRWTVIAVGAAMPILLAVAIFAAEHADDRRLVPEPDVAGGDHLGEVRDEEDHVVQNALTHLSVVKAGWLRFVILKYVFWAIKQRVLLIDRYQGSLGGIASIHFARWVELDAERGAKRRRLLFLSDYDGSWESYLGEFVDRASQGLTAVWSNTENFPTTRWVSRQGAQDEQRFKAWTRNRQLKTPVWYTAYPDRTLDNVENDVRIARLLATAKGSEEDAAWLALL